MKGIDTAEESSGSAPDNASLANYSRDLELDERMRPYPFEPRIAVVLALAGLIPMVPLLRTVMPSQEIALSDDHGGPTCARRHEDSRFSPFRVHLAYEYNATSPFEMAL